MKTSQKKVLTLEIKDIELHQYLARLAKKLNKPMQDSPHVTVRGPASRFSWLTKKGLSDSLKRRPDVEIAGAGIFCNLNNYVVYLKVNAEFLREFWHKPDFPVSRHGFNPHVTIFEGTREESQELFRLISEDSPRFFCKSLEVEEKVLGQRTLKFLSSAHGNKFLGRSKSLTLKENLKRNSSHHAFV